MRKENGAFRDCHYLARLDIEPLTRVSTCSESRRVRIAFLCSVGDLGWLLRGRSEALVVSLRILLSFKILVASL
jgi:hypothetical protein